MKSLLLALVVFALPALGCGDNAAAPTPDAVFCAACNRDHTPTCDAGFHQEDDHCRPDPHPHVSDAGVADAADLSDAP